MPSSAWCPSSWWAASCSPASICGGRSSRPATPRRSACDGHRDAPTGGSPAGADGRAGLRGPTAAPGTGAPAVLPRTDGLREVDAGVAGRPQPAPPGPPRAADHPGRPLGRAADQLPGGTQPGGPGDRRGVRPAAARARTLGRWAPGGLPDRGRGPVPHPRAGRPARAAGRRVARRRLRLRADHRLPCPAVPSLYPPRMAAQAVGIYLRISRKDDRSTSIAKQRVNTRRRAEQGWPSREVREFVDDGISASKGKARAGLDALMAAVRSGELVAVVVDTLDRITRDRGARAMWDLAAACEVAHVALVGASQDIDLGTASGEMSASVLAAAARFEARRTAERVKATNEHRRSRGLRALGGPPVWGLMRAGEGFIPDPERAPILLDAIDRVIAGELSIRGMAEEFTRRGIPTPGPPPGWRRLRLEPPSRVQGAQVAGTSGDDAA